MAGDYIRKIINKLKKKYNTSSLYELAECLDITVIIQPLGNVWGMYKYIKKNKVIFINSVLSEIERCFVLAHEIGHAVLHPKSSCYFINENNYVSKIKSEYEANVFAAEFLIDDAAVDQLELDGFSLEQLARNYYVPVEIMKLRFNYL
ncbi:MULTISPECIES: ImmA/IrrE family metallo-endopeptidase [unclassified Clostridium]|uniref:ImmA/IrrE family metallo-endopeptidase n=1 Tax=unclassified Clostridium TaxID=2614128 RepID=UPI000297998D|nr:MULTISPECIES: ImmA/IrrE family metallo-endopeptidase [unclassified Clostridium]EKQ52405.1 MAG: putative Zn peptidase [Clostridium sp. Maddingley MBC34-26]